MALTYSDSAALMTDMQFRGRIKVACLKFATFILAEVGTVDAHGARSRWANNCLMQPDQVASQVTNPVVMDPNVQASGSSIDDAGLQAAVELAVNTLM